ncbi:putative Thiamine-phosphate pyrophosphorylase (TMP pyrophosphorylase) (TMP-PPase) (Thiamine-phosphate synthase) (ThiE) [Thiocapsa sp. KS1]|nr:thiamine phosphate synthase [Thiocapsa sp. KS1]CRI64346.1 putative Thiamine-phosphate pyrophosphorylase (TMP pyrophosphorylase) (TMP-PPase) (Thiamine-phosphate synthase) (ThiE) [Thiocapsa sp. KS1]
MTHLDGLYLITPDTADNPDVLAEQVAQAISGGARLVQYRNKGADQQLRRDQAIAVLGVCRAAGVPLVINDDVALAAEIGADGVHLGREDGDPIAARRRLGADAIIGVSCYDDMTLAQAAERAGASYVAFGSFFPSATKPHAAWASLGLLSTARDSLRIPAVAIGGITPQNGGLLIAAGARMLAVVTGVFAQPDLAAAARAYASLFVDGDPR